tara:strand:+ start:404 stop:829 length:426 start_codon:yes stop_codon:yes gene_type:complete
MLRLQIEKIIKDSGLSATKTRKQVLTAFLKSKKPITLKEIKKTIAHVDRVTLFRILSVFEEKKIIHIINIGDNQKLYALCPQECKTHNSSHSHDHIHFQCDDCDDVLCLPIVEFPKINVPNYIINNVSINASGQCVKCCKN